MSGDLNKRTTIYFRKGVLFSISDLIRVAGEMDQEHFLELRWQSSTPLALLTRAPSYSFSVPWYHEAADEIAIRFTDAIEERVLKNLTRIVIESCGLPSPSPDQLRRAWRSA